MSNKLDGITLHAEGEANCYRLMRGGNWLAAIRMNGELLVWDQEQLLNAMLQGQQAAPVGELNIDAAAKKLAAHQRQQGEYGDAYQGAREDLAIWKRRALEAEARVRQQDQIIDQMGEDLNAINGPTFMGEPVLPRQQAREVVMPTLVVKESGEWGNAYERGFKAALREFARLNKGAGSHE